MIICGHFSWQWTPGFGTLRNHIIDPYMSPQTTNHKTLTRPQWSTIMFCDYHMIFCVCSLHVFHKACWSCCLWPKSLILDFNLTIAPDSSCSFSDTWCCFRATYCWSSTETMIINNVYFVLFLPWVLRNLEMIVCS